MSVSYEVISENDECGKILKEHFLNKFRKGYITIEGVTMPLRYAEMAREVFDWEVFDSDLWISSFPKTGTTWTQEMTWMIGNNVDIEAGKENLGVRFPFLELSAIFDHRETIRTNKEFNPPSFLADSLSFVKNMPEPRYIKTHLPWNLMPLQIQNKQRKPKIIYVARNPKDTCISYYHHSRLIEGYRGSFDDFCKLFLAGKASFGPFWHNVLSFWEHRNDENVLFLKYEDMRKDLDAVIRKVAEFMEKELKEEQIDRLKEHLSFESMKKNRSVNYETLVELNAKFGLVQPEKEGAFMRSGSVGGYKAIMSPELIAEFDAWTKEHIKGTGLTFDV